MFRNSPFWQGRMLWWYPSHACSSSNRSRIRSRRSGSNLGSVSDVALVGLRVDEDALPVEDPVRHQGRGVGQQDLQHADGLCRKLGSAALDVLRQVAHAHHGRLGQLDLVLARPRTLLQLDGLLALVGRYDLPGRVEGVLAVEDPPRRPLLPPGQLREQQVLQSLIELALCRTHTRCSSSGVEVPHRSSRCTGRRCSADSPAGSSSPRAGPACRWCPADRTARPDCRCSPARHTPSDRGDAAAGFPTEMHGCPMRKDDAICSTWRRPSASGTARKSPRPSTRDTGEGAARATARTAHLLLFRRSGLFRGPCHGPCRDLQQIRPPSERRGSPSAFGSWCRDACAAEREGVRAYLHSHRVLRLLCPTSNSDANEQTHRQRRTGRKTSRETPNGDNECGQLSIGFERRLPRSENKRSARREFALDGEGRNSCRPS